MRDKLIEICERELDRLVLEVHDGSWHANYRNQIPVIGGRYDPDRHAEHVRDVCRALAAFEQHRRTAPEWASQLPLCREKCEELIVDDHKPYRMLGYFGRSLAWNEWNLEQHPDFKTFGCGAMASSCCPLELRWDDQMRQLFRPKAIVGFARPLQWCAPGT
jgi:hypothetical protein